MKKSSVDDKEVMISFEYHNKILKINREIITLGADIDDIIMKTIQNTI
jgi:hypothetical protein